MLSGQHPVISSSRRHIQPSPHCCIFAWSQKPAAANSCSEWRVSSSGKAANHLAQMGGLKGRCPTVRDSCLEALCAAQYTPSKFSKNKQAFSSSQKFLVVCKRRTLRGTYSALALEQVQTAHSSRVCMAHTKPAGAPRAF